MEIVFVDVLERERERERGGFIGQSQVVLLQFFHRSISWSNKIEFHDETENAQRREKRRASVFVHKTIFDIRCARI